MPADLAPIADGVPQAAALLDVSESQIRTLVRSGHLARVPHLGTRIVIAVAELHRFAEANSEAA